MMDSIFTTDCSVPHVDNVGPNIASCLQNQSKFLFKTGDEVSFLNRVHAGLNLAISNKGWTITTVLLHD